MARRSAWTYAKTRKLKSMCRDGRLAVTLRDAADTLGFSFKAVQVKLHGFGLVAMNAQGESANGRRTNNFAWIDGVVDGRRDLQSFND